MTNHGGEPNEPTSYDLRPPTAPPAQQAQSRQQPQSVPPQNPHGAYEPTQSAPVGAHQAGGQPAGSGAQPAGGGQPSGGPADAAGPGQGQEPGSGRLIGGRYQLLSRLGHGGMGTVWRARDLVVEREVAVKEPRLPENLSETERQTAYQRMQREARAAARIDHPSVVTMHDVVIEDGKPWVVMELVQGQSLAGRLQEGTLDPRDAARVGLAVLGALQAAHEAGVLHRDVKPDNVLLGRGDRVVLTDFGIAQVEGEQGLTETGAFVGSPEFIAPERVLGQHPGPASDLWSLGVVLYAAVEGMSPYRRSHTPSTLQAVLSAEPPTPARASGPLAMVIMQLLRKDPLARPPHGEIRAALESVTSPALAPTRVAALPAGGNRWVPPVLQDDRKAQYGLGVGVLAVVVALVLIFANPFGGNGLPGGWEVRPEKEAVDASIAVPADYERNPVDDENAITYDDPSNVFHVYLERVDAGQNDTDVPAPTGSAWEKYYKSGGDSNTEIQDEKVTTKKVQHQGRTAYETVVDYVPGDVDTSTDTSPYRYRWHELLVPQGGGSKFYWRLQVSMPAEGWAEPRGEQLYSDVVDHLELKPS